MKLLARAIRQLTVSARPGPSTESRDPCEKSGCPLIARPDGCAGCSMRSIFRPAGHGSTASCASRRVALIARIGSRQRPRLTPIFPVARVFVVTGATDMRKGFNDRSVIVAKRLGLDPPSEAVCLLQLRTQPCPESGNPTCQPHLIRRKFC